MIKYFCDICEKEYSTPYNEIYIKEYGAELRIFVCRRCYEKMKRIIKKSNVRERRVELKELARGKEPNWKEFWKER